MGRTGVRAPFPGRNAVGVAPPVPPEPVPQTLAGVGACAVNFACAYMLARHRMQGGSLTRVTFLSARNDVLANVANVAAGLARACSGLGLARLIVGLGIAPVNADAGREVMGRSVRCCRLAPARALRYADGMLTDRAFRALVLRVGEAAA